ncbi:MAG TPA: hypothetical protein VHA56_15455 [Mucilaginibacter sp.]|nr:hypothetical protein [Mucilaginibacter sp.]
MNVLVTAAASAKAHKIKAQLSNDRVILGDYHQLPAFLLKSGNLIQLPDPSSHAYAHQMLTLCLDQGVEAIYVLEDMEYAALAEALQLFTEYGIEIIATE